MATKRAAARLKARMEREEERQLPTDEQAARIQAARARTRGAGGSRWHSPGAQSAARYSMGLTAIAAFLLFLGLGPYLWAAGWAIDAISGTAAGIVGMLLALALLAGWRSAATERAWREAENEAEARRRAEAYVAEQVAHIERTAPTEGWSPDAGNREY